MMEREKTGARVIALGTFDGVHLGHQELIRRGRALAEKSGGVLRVCTFDRHPLEILRPEAAPSLLTTAAEQAERIREAGAEELLALPFTRETAAMEPEAFLDSLGNACPVSALVVGWNYTFGNLGRGDADLLRAEGARRGWRVEIVPPVRTPGGEIVSSTAIREKLVRGDIDGANEMLGRPYEISGTVVSGKHQGSRIGFPTANIRPGEKKQLPAYGVYICRLESGKENWPALVNIGLQPTLPSGGVTVEAHALGETIDLYGQEARVRLLRRLRGEIRFGSAEQLAEQIRRDRDEAEAWFDT